VDGVDLKLTAADRGSHDVHNGVCGADFVKVNSFWSYAVNFSFGFG
jgi:hypothetical protein